LQHQKKRSNTQKINWRKGDKKTSMLLAPKQSSDFFLVWLDAEIFLPLQKKILRVDHLVIFANVLTCGVSEFDSG